MASLKSNNTVFIKPLGDINEPYTFIDILDLENNHVACISSITDSETKKAIKKEGVYFDSDGYPEIVLEDKLIDLKAIKKGLKKLEQNTGKKFVLKITKENLEKNQT